MITNLEKAYLVMTQPRSIRWFLRAWWDEIKFEVGKMMRGLV